MESQQLRQMILNELPVLMRKDSSFREAVLEISRNQFADRTETDNRFDQIMGQLKRLMDKDSKKWEDTQKQLVALTTKIANLEQRLDQKIEQDNRKWEDNHKQIVALTTAITHLEQRLDQKIEQDNKKWEENQRKWEENQRKWEEKWAENQRQLTTAIQNLDRKYESTIGALGARWGLQSEASFRNGLAGILRDLAEIQVSHVIEKDEEGVVFGRPEEVELDLIIKNGVLIICEIKSAMSKSEMYIFEKKVRFYEQKHNRHANRRIVISPMVSPNAKPVAENLGIEIYSYADDVNLE